MNELNNNTNNIGWYFDNSYSRLPNIFKEDTSPIPVKSPEILILNKDLAKDLVEFVKEMKLDKFYVLGHQLGGCIGLELAHLIPDKVQGVLSFSMFPLKGLKVPGFEINTME